MRAIQSRFSKRVAAGLLVGAASLLGGCTTAGVLLTAAGVATDTSVTWEIVEHLHARMTEGGDTPCHRLDSVERALNPRCGAFGPLGALHPDALGTPFALALEARGHTARAGLGSFDGVQPRGFELALRGSHRTALDWWIARVPELANRVPPVQGNQLPWVPLARVLTPNFLTHPASRAETVEFLLARGANPWQKLPHDAGSSVVQYARMLKSPQLALLDPPAVPTVPAVTVNATATGLGSAR